MQHDQPSQLQTVLDWLKTGQSITSMEAIQKWRITRLGAHICELKNNRGYNIQSERIPSRRGGSYSRYWLEKDEQASSDN
ncbi:MAG: hypothetical protein KGV51_06920 [Moraxellaceae bacterium]|nr:hypothetical protein [Moraxellaceae bacterium]